MNQQMNNLSMGHISRCEWTVGKPTLFPLLKLRHLLSNWSPDSAPVYYTVIENVTDGRKDVHKTAGLSRLPAVLVVKKSESVGFSDRKF